MKQPNLFEDQPKKKLTIDDKFEIWIAENPTVVPLYLKFARQALDSGRTHYSVKAITERVRWETNITLRSEDDFKTNNNFSAPMARLLVRRDPRLTGFFAFRKRISLP